MAYTFSSVLGSSVIGDCIGMESCSHLHNNEDEDFAPSSFRKQDHLHYHHHHHHHHQLRVKKDQRCKEMRKEFPPPIPLLARTENLPSHMRWVLKRHYTRDGRLILREEKVRHHEYFRAHRCNGRLILQLVPLEDNVLGLPFTQVDEEEKAVEEVESIRVSDGEEKEVEEDVQESDINEGIGDVIDWRRGIIKEEMECEEDQRVPAPMESGVGGNGSGSSKCFSCNTSVVTPRSTCLFGMPVPAAGPVHF